MMNPPSPSPSSAEATMLHKPAFILFLLLFAANFAVVLLRIKSTAQTQVIEALFLIATAATLLAGLARRLPAQNVVASAGLILALSGIATVVSQKTGMPFGPCLFTEAFGAAPLALLPWPVPLIWLVAIVSSRGVARLIVRPWRKTNHYGFWVIGLTVLFVVTLDLGLEAYAAAQKHFWIWRTAANVPNWYGAPWTNFLGWAVVSLGIVVVATPWLINKNPAKQPTDYHPLIVWVLPNAYLATANAMQHFWTATAVCTLASIVAVIFAIRGARW